MARTWTEQQVERMTARPADQMQRGAARPYVCCEVFRDGSRNPSSSARYYDVFVLTDGWERIDLKALNPDGYSNGEGRPVHPILRNVSCPAAIVLDAGRPVVVVGAVGLVGAGGDALEVLTEQEFDVVPTGEGRGVIMAGGGAGGVDWGVVAD